MAKVIEFTATKRPRTARRTATPAPSEPLRIAYDHDELLARTTLEAIESADRLAHTLADFVSAAMAEASDDGATLGTLRKMCAERGLTATWAATLRGQ